MTERLIFHVNIAPMINTVEPMDHSRLQNRSKQLWLSLQIYNMLVSFTPMVEPYSVNEAFLDLTGNREAQGDPAGYARRIKHRLALDFKLTCSIGIGGNKLFAKVASDCQKPNGISVIKPEMALDWLHSLSVQRLPGLGGKIIGFLQSVEIWTIGELALVDEAVLTEWFGSDGSLLYNMVWGREDGLFRPDLPLKSVR